MRSLVWGFLPGWSAVTRPVRQRKRQTTRAENFMVDRTVTWCAQWYSLVRSDCQVRRTSPTFGIFEKKAGISTSTCSSEWKSCRDIGPSSQMLLPSFHPVLGPVHILCVTTTKPSHASNSEKRSIYTMIMHLISLQETYKNVESAHEVADIQEPLFTFRLEVV